MQTHYQRKKISRYINNNIEISSDDFNEASDLMNLMNLMILTKRLLKKRHRIHTCGKCYCTCEPQTRDPDESGCTFEL